MSEFTENMRKILLERKLELIQNLMKESADFEDAVNNMDLADPGDVAANDLDKQTMDAIGAQNALALNRIDAALGRIENGKYGMCAKCGKSIAKDRLEVIPEAVLCIDCKMANERGRG